MLRAMVFRSPWGWIGVAESAKGIRALTLPQLTKSGAESSLRASAGPFLIEEPSAPLRSARTQLLRYLAGSKRSFSLPLDVAQRTAFRRRVWRVLRHMPYGSLRSYQWVASRIGGRRYARAVGTAVGANPLPIVIPCHRIVAQDKSLGGFSGGLAMKRRLLSLEGTLSEVRR
jgi:methylated-DNA-[protein]-cysteine S-methyltransferase